MARRSQLTITMPSSSVSWPQGGPGALKAADSRVWFVVGVEDPVEEDGSDEEDCDAAVAALLSDAWRDASSVVGFFAELDFQSNTRGSRSAQIRRLRTMIDASLAHGAPLQVNIRGRSKPRASTLTMPGSDVADPDPYVDAVRELVKCMLERAGGENCDSGNGVAVHLSSWAGSCDNMIKL